MQIALDATPLTLTSGGLSRYTAELACALQRVAPDERVILVSDQPFAAPCGVHAAGGPRNRLERFWWSFGLERALSRAGADLFHGTNFSVPYLPRRPAVLSLHDLSPWMHPAWHSNAGRVRRRTPALIRLRLATLVLTDTDVVRRAVIERFHLHPERVAAVALAAAPLFRPVEPVERPPYFLFTGTLEPRKNVPSLIDAWRTVRGRRPVDLVLAGRRRDDFPPVPPEPGLHILGEVPDAALPSLYSGALALVYPSAYEGFGLPVLEAFQCGACVVTSRDPALLEVSGGAALHVELPELAAAMWRVLDDVTFRRELQARALERARAFSWERTALLTRAVYQQAQDLFDA